MGNEVSGNLEEHGRPLMPQYVGRLGSAVMTPVQLEYVTSPDGYIGIPLDNNLVELVQTSEEGSVLWVRAQPEEIPPEPCDTAEYCHGRIVFDRDKHELKVDGEVFRLANLEFELLNYLSNNPGRALPREQMYTAVWGHDLMLSTRTLDVHVRKLRHKLGPDFQRMIRTVVNKGYLFDDKFDPSVEQD